MCKMSTQKEVVSAVNAESALEKAAATIPTTKIPSTSDPRCSLAIAGRMLSDIAGSAIAFCSAKISSSTPRQRKRKLMGAKASP